MRRGIGSHLLCILGGLLGLMPVFIAPSSANPPVDVNEKLRALMEKVPGRRGFLFTELTKEGPRELFGENANERFAIGSGFKLFILGTLMDDVNAGRRRIEDIMKLQAEWIGPPHSEMAAWPLGSPVTLNTLALKMISVSDNTATDHLLAHLGRERVEQQMRIMGHSDPAINQPLLFTREMVMLRDKKHPERAREWKRLNAEGRRKYLHEVIDKLHDFDVVDFDSGDYTLAEWYATPMDTARALHWIQKHTNHKVTTSSEDVARSSEVLFKILTIDPKVKYDAKLWKFVGFKGGSEDQLLAGNWLLHHQNGNWYTLHTFFNSPREKLSKELVEKVVQEMFEEISKAVN